MPIIIGAAIGAYSGYMIGRAAGATGWGMAAYIAGGAAIGGLSGGAAVGVSALGGSAMIAGSVAGAVGGAGFSGLATGWNGDAMLKGAAFGAISGFVGGAVGSAIGGGLGAFAGGAASNFTSQMLYNKGDISRVNGLSVLGAGAFSYGMYHSMSFASWKWGGGNNLGGNKVNYDSFCTMNAQMQRSRFWQREFGGYLMDDGAYIKGSYKHSSKYHYDFDGAYKDLNSSQVEHAISRVHTHWTTDNTSYYYNNEQVSAEEAYVYENMGGSITTKQTYLSFSPGDKALYGNTMLLNRVGGGLYSNWGGTPTTTHFNDVFLRFFLFPHIP